MGKKKEDGEVKEILLSYGYKKIGPYIDAKTPIKCEDSDGYIVYPVLYRLYSGKTPLRFYRANPNTIDNINHYIYINNINVKLRSGIFLDAKSKLTFECACGQLYNTSWSNFTFHNKYYCDGCAPYKGARVPFKTIKELLNNKGLVPLFSENEYIGITNTKLPVINSIGYKALFNPGYCNNRMPAWFHESNPYTIDNINLYLFNQTNGEYQCLSNIYNGNKEPLIILHKTCNRTFNAKWINLYRTPSENEPNRHGTQCPYCTGLRYQSLHAVVLKQLFQNLMDGTILEDQSCRNPRTNCILPTDIVNHNNKIVVEIQSWFHDRPEQQVKDAIKKNFWENKGYKVYTPDIRKYTVLEMAQIFFPSLIEIPQWVRYNFESKLNLDVAQNLLNSGLLVKEVALEMGVSIHRIYDNIYHKKLFYPENYPNKKFINTEYVKQQVTVQTAG